MTRNSPRANWPPPEYPPGDPHMAGPDTFIPARRADRARSHPIVTPHRPVHSRHNRPQSGTAKTLSQISGVAGDAKTCVVHYSNRPMALAFTPALIRQQKGLRHLFKLFAQRPCVRDVDHCWMFYPPSTYAARPEPDLRALLPRHRMPAKVFDDCQPDVACHGEEISGWPLAFHRIASAVGRVAMSNCTPSPTTAISW
jgi:hypothetical protein